MSCWSLLLRCATWFTWLTRQNAISILIACFNWFSVCKFRMMIDDDAMIFVLDFWRFDAQNNGFAASDWSLSAVCQLTNGDGRCLFILFWVFSSVASKPNDTRIYVVTFANLYFSLFVNQFTFRRRSRRHYCCVRSSLEFSFASLRW